MIYIENEGALFRSIGFMAGAPDEVYSPGKGWVPYQGETPKPMGWGEQISEQAAKEMMARMDQAAAKRS